MGKLILTRKPGESVKIGKDIVLTIREVHAKKVYVQSSNGKCLWLQLLEIGQVPTEQGACKMTIAAISGRQVRLHFEADNSVKIVRTELLP